MFGPQAWSPSYESLEHFPSIRDAVASGNWTLAQLTVERVAGIVRAAAEGLEGKGKGS